MISRLSLWNLGPWDVTARRNVPDRRQRSERVWNGNQEGKSARLTQGEKKEVALQIVIQFLCRKLQRS